MAAEAITLFYKDTVAIMDTWISLSRSGELSTSRLLKINNGWKIAFANSRGSIRMMLCSAAVYYDIIVYSSIHTVAIFFLGTYKQSITGVATTP